MKIIVRVFVLIAVMALSGPFILQAREVSIEQVQQNVLNLHKSVMDGQPAISVKNFKQVMASDAEFVLLDVRSEAELTLRTFPAPYILNGAGLNGLSPI